MPAKRPVVVGITGASGHLLARRCVDRLIDYGYPIELVCTGPGARVWRDELDDDLAAAVAHWRTRGKLVQHRINDVGASIASGGLTTHGMLVVPCSMGTLSSIAAGSADNVLERAADVTLKEYRTLVLVPRETPLSALHLENMLKLARLGVRIVPPMPAFYLRPATILDAVDYLATRILNALGVAEAIEDPPAYSPSRGAGD
jgi:4-hydroxy-3-polyprenylbenzoate decarboxylase